MALLNSNILVMNKTLYITSIVLCTVMFFNCKEKRESVSNQVQPDIEVSKAVDTKTFKHIYVEIDNKKYDFSYDTDTLAVFLTTSYGKTHIFFEFTKEVTFVPDAKNNRLNAFYGTDYKMDIRNINFDDKTIRFDEYKDDILLKENTIIVSENITKSDFYDTLESGFRLNDDIIKEKLNNKSCPVCVVVITIFATTVVGDSRGSNKELCEQQNKLVAENCANKPDFCLVSEGPCKLKCVPCSEL